MAQAQNEQANSDSQRVVARAACLNCRTAKRRCDGAQPVCGPCVNRGVEAGGCNFVTSKRGGPRYKGVKGADAIKVKAERDRRLREDQRLKKKLEKGESSRSVRSNPQLTPSSNGGSGSTSSDSPSRHDIPQHQYGSQQNPTPPNASYSYTPAVFAPVPSPYQGSTYSTPSSAQQFMSPPDGIARDQPYYHSHSQQVPGQQYIPQHQQRSSDPSAQMQPMNNISALPTATDPFGQPAHSLPLSDAFPGFGSGELSFANLELWQRLQERDSGQGENGQFSDFLSRLEVLPKAGIIGGGECGDPLDVLMDWEGGHVGGNVQDNEQGARTLLSDFYELVYPACPVLPSPGSLPSLAFYFSGKGPCGLFAALSAVVALHLPEHEAYKTLKASQHPLQRYEGSPVGGSVISTQSNKPAEDVAAYHAKTSEFILHQYEEHQRTCFTDSSAANPFDGMDEELITIEAGAAHTLLCLYYYGRGKPLGHQRAYKHAVDGWNLMQKLDIQRKTHEWGIDEGKEEPANSRKPFAAEIKLEWAKRVYWCSYAAATVMSCTGGFAPFGNPKDGAMDLQLRPSLEDVSAWGVMVRGAQQVSKSYRLLYELDMLRTRVIDRGTNMTAEEIQQTMSERQNIFNAMLKLDTEIGNYTRFDAGWRDPPPEPGDQGFISADKELARSLKASGRLMTSGSIIILHRAQAFSNARVFMQPQCGIPQAGRLQNKQGHDVGGNTIMHRAEIIELPPPRLGDTPVQSQAGSDIATFPSAYPNDSHSRFDQGQYVSQDVSQPSHPFLTDRFAGGPFEPPHSLDRCRFAASTMVGTLPRILRDKGRVPKLPPYSACSYVLGAYSILMLTLLIQVRGEMAVQNQDGSRQNISVQGQELKRQIELYRAPVRDMISALRKFADVWAKAVDYELEVSTLLTANESLG